MSDKPSTPPGPNTSAGNIPAPGGPPPTQKPPEQEPVKQTASLPRVMVKREDLASVQTLDPNTKDPDRHYRWVRTTARDDDGSISVRQKQLMGYEIEHIRPGGPMTIAKPDSTSDGSIRMGDLVLMSCPKALQQEREKENFHFNERRITASSETFKSRTRGQRGAKLVGDESEERE